MTIEEFLKVWCSINFNRAPINYYLNDKLISLLRLQTYKNKLIKSITCKILHTQFDKTNVIFEPTTQYELSVNEEELLNTLNVYVPEGTIHTTLNIYLEVN